MNLLDILILILIVSALYRGHHIGLTRQIAATAGFLLGLVIGSFAQKYTVTFSDDAMSRALITLFTTLGMGFLFLTIGEHVGMRVKLRVMQWKIDRFDNWLGSGIAVVTLLVAVWLSAAILASMPLQSTQRQIRGSAIVSTLNANLPSATRVISSLGHLINPNGFPQVFTGNEPVREGVTTIPGISPQLQQAIDNAKASVVKLEGLGCGGIVQGSGFVIDSDLVATNAHVVAGVPKVYVRDANGQHTGTVVWFDPELDFAVVRANNLAGGPLLLNKDAAADGTRGAVLGYPGGGPLTAGGAEVLDDFRARGRDIYNQRITTREVYSLAAHVIPGNSGGPVIGEDGRVIGLVFAQSTSYDNVGYALANAQLSSGINIAQTQNRAVASGSCAD
jgi:S1-C subfamily serine protease